MSEIWERIKRCIEEENVNVSSHGYDELAADGLFAGEIVSSVEIAVVIEAYPEYPKGPCVLVFQQDSDGEPVHVVWGIPRGEDGPAVLVTAYRPDPEKWSDDFLRRAE